VKLLQDVVPPYPKKTIKRRNVYSGKLKENLKDTKNNKENKKFSSRRDTLHSEHPLNKKNTTKKSKRSLQDKMQEARKTEEGLYGRVVVWGRGIY
jgi:RNA polymerase-binding transcription factor DksA